jgi:hypothetical protein
MPVEDLNNMPNLISHSNTIPFGTDLNGRPGYPVSTLTQQWRCQHSVTPKGPQVASTTLRCLRSVHRYIDKHAGTEKGHAYVEYAEPFARASWLRMRVEMLCCCRGFATYKTGRRTVITGNLTSLSAGL